MPPATLLWKVLFRTMLKRDPSIARPSRPVPQNQKSMPANVNVPPCGLFSPKPLSMIVQFSTTQFFKPASR